MTGNRSRPAPGGSPVIGAIGGGSLGGTASKSDADGLAHEAAEGVLIKELEDLQYQCVVEMQEEELNPGERSCSDDNLLNLVI